MELKVNFAAFYIGLEVEPSVLSVLLGEVLAEGRERALTTKQKPVTCCAIRESQE